MNGRTRACGEEEDIIGVGVSAMVEDLFLRTINAEDFGSTMEMDAVAIKEFFITADEIVECARTIDVMGKKHAVINKVWLRGEDGDFIL
jgi:hypothetical protein